MTLAQIARSSQRLRRSGLQAKLWPNGEISFHLPKRLKEVPQVAMPDVEPTDLVHCLLRSHGVEATIKFLRLLGLSSVRNFDKPKAVELRRGLKGITSLGRRRVRNAAFLLTREAGKRRLTFATVTLPPLPHEEMTIVHMEWHKVIERYRLLLSRHLRANGLTGEVVGVSEIQEHRYEQTGFPVLHCHFVFVGRSSRASWALSPSEHDAIWYKSLSAVLPLPVPNVSSSCQLKAVEKDAEGYLGKYMSKGAAAIANIVTNGYEWALPRQWWSCSRSLVQRMGEQMRYFTNGASWLVSKATVFDASIWAFYSVVSIEMPDGLFVDVGSYGRLTPQANRSVRIFLELDKPTVVEMST